MQGFKLTRGEKLLSPLRQITSRWKPAHVTAENVTSNSNLIFVWRPATNNLVVPKSRFPHLQLTRLTREPSDPLET